MSEFSRLLARVAQDPRVIEIENEGADEDRYFIHLRPPFYFGGDPFNQPRSRTVGSIKELRIAVLSILPREE